MKTTSSPQPLLQNTLISFFICSLIVGICYFWADPLIAIWVDQENFKQFHFFEYCTYIPDLLVWATTLYYFYFVVTFPGRYSNFSPRKKLPFSPELLCVANSIAISIFIKDALKYIFGRYWPSTWINNNPSLLQGNAYGFHLFHAGSAYQSFPSGHTTIIVAAMSVVWITYPKLICRLLALLAIAAVIVGLIAEDYHFLGDCVAGAWIGITVARYVTAYSLDLKKEEHL